MGNAISNTYDTLKPSSTGGIDNLWIIQSGRHKQNKNVFVSIFIFKKSTAHHAESEALLTKEVEHITKLRHPNILKLVEPLIKDKSLFVFAAEPISCCLANILYDTQVPVASMKSYAATLVSTATSAYHQKTGTPVHDDFEDFACRDSIDILDIQTGVASINSALCFLQQINLLHLNISPESIYINKMNDWKLAGFNYATTIPADTQTVPYKYFESAVRQRMNYVAPELILDQVAGRKSDIWSLACLIYELHSFASSKQPHNIFDTQDVQKFKGMVDNIATNPFLYVEDETRKMLRSTLMKDVSMRPTASEFGASPYFNSILLSTLRFLQSFVEQPHAIKVQFLKGLPQVLPSFPPKGLKFKLLPLLLDQLKQPTLVPFLMQPIFQIVTGLTETEFSSMVLPDLKPVFSIKDNPECTMSLVEYMDFILGKCSKVALRDEILPLFLSVLDLPIPHAQQKLLKLIPDIVKQLDVSITKNTIFPRLDNLYGETLTVGILTAIVLCFISILPYLDTFSILEKLLPLMKTKKPATGGMALALVGLYSAIAKNDTSIKVNEANIGVQVIEVVGGEIVPELWKLAVCGHMDLEQYKTTMKCIHELGDLVDAQILKRLSNMAQHQIGKDTTNENGVVTASDFQAIINGKTGASAQQPPLPSRNTQLDSSTTFSATKPIYAQNTALAPVQNPLSNHAPSFLQPSNQSSDPFASLPSSYLNMPSVMAIPAPTPKPPVDFKPPPQMTLSIPRKNVTPASTVSQPVIPGFEVGGDKDKSFRLNPPPAAKSTVSEFDPFA